jgi:hypothetical protein
VLESVENGKILPKVTQTAILDARVTVARSYPTARSSCPGRCGRSGIGRWTGTWATSRVLSRCGVERLQRARTHSTGTELEREEMGFSGCPHHGKNDTSLKDAGGGAGGAAVTSGRYCSDESRPQGLERASSLRAAAGS